MQSQGGGGGPESRYAAMSYAAHSDGVDLYGHGPDAYTVLQHQHHLGHGPPGLSPTGHHNLGLHGSPPGGHHHHSSSKRSADAAGLNLKQDPMVGDVTMSSIGMGHSTMDEGHVGPNGGAGGGQNGGSGQPNKKTPPPNGKKTKGRVKIKMEFIDNKLRRYTTFSKRKTGIMKKAYELSTLTGTQVMLLVASETGHVYTFATRKLQPMITSEAGKALIQTCLNSPDPPSSTVDQRMSATGFEETELTYTLHDEDQKDSDSEGEGDGEAGSSEAGGPSRSPSPAERSYSSEGSAELAQPPPPPNKSGKGSGRSGTVVVGSDPVQAHQTTHRSSHPVNGSSGRHNAVSPAVTNNPQSGKPPTSSAGLPVNLTTNQLASLTAALPGLSGLSLPLPRGANLATLLASASGLSSLLSGGGGGNGEGSGNASGSASAAAAETASRKNLPRLISLAHLGAALQQQQQQQQQPATSAKDATSTTTSTSRGLSDARHDNSALNLQTSSNKDKKGNAGSNKSPGRAGGGGGGGKKKK